MTAVQGGNFWNGFAAGAISSLAASAWGGNSTEEGFFKENNFAHGTRIVHHGIGFGGNAGMIAFGTIAGGAGAALTGGNFWQGAVTGLVVAGLNHAMHDGDGEPGEPPAKKAPNLKEANDFFNKNTSTLTEYVVDAKTVDLNFVNTDGWIPKNQYTVQTLLHSKQGLVFGRLKLIYEGNNQVSILPDVYDFNMDFSNPLKVSEFFSSRNFLTAVGNIYAGYGVPFTFVFKGLNTINYNSTTTQVQSFKQYP